jgi:hypothetical protein
VQEGVYERFVAGFAAHTKKVHVGNGLDAGTVMGPLANGRRPSAIAALVEDATSKGAKLLTGGSRGDQGFFFAPTVLSDVPMSAKVMDDEPFGPVALMRPFKTFDEAVEQANRLPFGLAAYAFTENARQANLVADALDLPFPTDEFDVVTVAFGLRNMGDYPLALREMRRVLKPGGHLFILDFSQPEAPLCHPYRLYLHHVLPKLAGLLTGQMDAYEYLGTSIEQFPCGQAMIALLEANGYTAATATPMTFGVVTAYEAVKI